MAPLSETISDHAEPQIDLDSKRADALLSKDLMKLSFNDRNNITEEIHGVQSLAVDENECMRETALSQLQHQIDILHPSKKQAYSLAQTFPVTYVNDSAFQLRFLRAELFDVQRAAKRMVDYLDLLHELFGNEVLERPLRIVDFKSKEDKALLRGGVVQLLPYRDRSGRRVMVILSDIMSQNHIKRVRCGDRILMDSALHKLGFVKLTLLLIFLSQNFE